MAVTRRDTLKLGVAAFLSSLGSKHQGNPLYFGLI